MLPRCRRGVAPQLVVARDLLFSEQGPHPAMGFQMRQAVFAIAQPGKRNAIVAGKAHTPQAIPDWIGIATDSGTPAGLICTVSIRIKNARRTVSNSLS